MSLKTLKDLIVLCDVCKKHPENNCSHPCCKTYKRVKAEAIEWVKECKDCPTEEKLMYRVTLYPLCLGCQKLMNFTNIIEEDLK